MTEQSAPTVHAAIRALAASHVIAHPTETVFGLAANPFDPAAMTRLIHLKGRARRKGFILLIPDRAWLDRLVLPLSPLAHRLMTCFWPGPLTLVLPARPGLPSAVTGATACVAVRHSSSPLVTALLHHWQKPLASTSANPTGHPPAECAAEVRRMWGGRIPVVLEGRALPGGIPSTLVRVEADHACLLRPGAVSIMQLQHSVPEISLCAPRTHTPPGNTEPS